MQTFFVLSQPHEQIPLDLIEPEAPTLDNFVLGDNAELVAALRACQNGQGPQFIYLWGPPGSGRSHLLRAVTPTQRWRVPEFDEDVSLYTVDNIESLDPEDLERLFHLMNAVRSHPGARLVSAGSRPVGELDIRDDIKTRLSWGLVYRLNYLTEQQARSEFVRLAKSRGIEVTPEIEHWVAVYCPRDMRSLRRLLDQIDDFAMRRKRRVTVSLLHEWASSNLFEI